MYKTWVVLILCLVAASTSRAQSGWDIGAYVGMQHYFGDLNNDYDILHPGYAVGLLPKYVINNRMAISLRTGYGTVRGDDRWQRNLTSRHRNLRVETEIIDFTPEFEFNFTPYNHSDKAQGIAPYIAVGATIFKFNPTAREFYTGKKFDLRPISTEGVQYAKWSYGFNLTAGLKYRLNNKYTLHGFVTTRILMTDYLDDVSGFYATTPNTIPDEIDTYVDETKLTISPADDTQSTTRSLIFSLIDPSLLNDPDRVANPGNRYSYFQNQIGRQRGDSKINDSYSTIGIGITYFLGKEKCPTVEK